MPLKKYIKLSGLWFFLHHNYSIHPPHLKLILCSATQTLKMNSVRLPPPVVFVKINIFEAVPDFSLDNGNENGIEIIILDHNGFLIWGTMSPVHGLTYFQIQLWAIHMEMKGAYARRRDVLIETEHLKSFRILKRQNFMEAFQEGLVGIYKLSMHVIPFSLLIMSPYAGFTQ